MVKSYDSVLDWVKQNHWTVWGIIIILGLVMYHEVTYQDKMREVVAECNKHYRTQLTYYCPAALENIYDSDLNISIEALSPIKRE